MEGKYHFGVQGRFEQQKFLSEGKKKKKVKLLNVLNPSQRG